MISVIHVLCFSLFAIFASDGKSVPKDGSFNIITKIIEGQRLNITERPYMLSLHKRNGGFKCGAFIISTEWGLTAQHCFEVLDPQSYAVRAGSDQFQKGGTAHRLKEIIFHDMDLYENRIPISDIALFKVIQPFIFSTKIQPALLPAEGSFPEPPVLVVSGWGSLRKQSVHNAIIGKTEVSVYLMATRVPLISYEQCVKIYPGILRNDLHSCYGGAGHDACTGDSGGPLGDRTTVYGIVSFGKGCGEPNVPGVYTRISAYRTWIREMTNI